MCPRTDNWIRNDGIIQNRILLFYKKSQNNVIFFYVDESGKYDG